ncbi:class I SAM-dependent methyltransferase [Ekhidna sp.]|uniref:class I SAM-dependent methyltransferase n=1 Tax=Ekhidna sp. TaxID=2608089 RepID=UPI003297F004
MKINKIIPKALKEIVLRKSKESIIRSINLFNADKNEVSLTDKHLKNCKLLESRIKLLNQIPSKGIVAELGVDNGEFSEKILKYNKPKKLHLIDSWSNSRYNSQKEENVRRKFKENSNVIINKGLSTEVVSEFGSNYFDWIYIDTVHDYLTTREELSLYAPKVKNGGIIAGHDYTSGNWPSLVPYGVIEAVHEFCFKENWELIFLTVENFPSFAIKKIN